MKGKKLGSKIRNEVRERRPKILDHYKQLYGKYFWHQRTQMKTSKPIILESGRGSKLKDLAGKEYIDLMAGQGNVILGYGREDMARVLYEKAKSLAFSPCAIFADTSQLLLAEKLAQILPPGITRSFFQTSGSEANEAAFKMARQYHYQKSGKPKYKILSLWMGYHGATFGALGATGRPERRLRYEPLMPGFVHVFPPNCYRCYFGKTYPGCDIDCARQLEHVIGFEGADTVAAFIIEPVATSGGVNVPPQEYFEMVDQICQANDVLLIIDELVTGFGRTGKMFATTHHKMKPDMITLGKGITGGYAPLSAVCTTEEVYQAFYSDRDEDKFNHVITYGGNPISCAAGLKCIEIIEKEGLVERAEEIGHYLGELLREELEGHPLVGRIVGQGLEYGVEIVADKESKRPVDASVQARFKERAYDRGVVAFIVGGGAPNTGVCVPFMTPLTIDREDLSYAVQVVGETLDEIAKTP